MPTIEETILDQCRQLPPLSQSASQLLTLIQREHTIDEVVSIVQLDAALTTNLLKVVNSAAMGLTRTITSPAQAVSYVGDKMVMGLAIATCTGPIFEGALEGYQGDAGSLWRHDLYTAITAREIANRGSAVISPELAFTAGIVHDVGKAVISQYLRSASRKLTFDVTHQESPDFLIAERDQLGTDHCQVGGVLAFKWRLPAPLKESIQFHHRPRESSDEQRALVYAIHVADHLAMKADQSTGADRLQYPLDSDFTEHLGITYDDLDPLMARVEREFAKVVGGLYEKG